MDNNTIGLVIIACLAWMGYVLFQSLSVIERIETALRRIGLAIEQPGDEYRSDSGRALLDQKVSHKWQYLLVEPHWMKDQSRFIYLVNGELDDLLSSAMEGCVDARLFLDRFGRQGWELLNVSTLSKVDGGYEFSYYFKRHSPTS